MQGFVKILTKQLTREQLDSILQAVTDASDDGYCILCGKEDVPVDEDGNEIDGDDVSEAYEWREVHADDCPVTLIEQSFKPQ
jgi:hypothetical protein